MSKYKKGIVEDIKKEKVFEENQQHLKDKYNMTGEAVVIVEKNNLLKYLIKYGVALIRLVVPIWQFGNFWQKDWQIMRFHANLSF